jgi:tetratricopeptide (TPR) repeat protein
LIQKRGPYIQLISSVALVLLLTACGSKSTYITFESVPNGADIYVKPIDQQEYRQIGITPLNFRADEIEKKYSGSGPISVQYRKAGFAEASVIITELSAIDLKVKMELISESGLDDQRQLNWIIDTMFEIRRLVSAKRYEDALKKIDKVKETVPQVSAVYELEGGIFYLLHKYSAALDAYSAAVRYNPKNLDNIRMKEICQKKVKGI